MSIGYLETSHQSRDIETARSLAASYASVAVTTLAVGMKHPSFDGEDEHRLVGHQLTIEGEQLGDSHLKFRASGDRVVPFEEVVFAPDWVREVIVGFSSPVSEGAIRLLLGQVGLKQVVSRSDVPVR